MNQLSKTWLQEKIAQLESASLREDAYRLDENGHMTLAAYRAALASLESEPVYQCQFACKDHSGETEWVWEDVNQEFYEQFSSGGRLGERRVLYTGPLSAPGVPGTTSNDVASVEIQVKAIEQAVNAVLSVDTVASTMAVRALFMNYIGDLQLRAEVSE